MAAALGNCATVPLINRSEFLRIAISIVWAAILMVSAATAGGCASSRHHDVHTPVDHHAAADILSREHAWAEAMRHHDMTALEEILATEFRLSFVDVSKGPPGKPEVPRELWLSNLEQMTFGPVEMIGMHVSMQGEHVATVRMRMELHDWKWGEHVIPPSYDVTDIWVRRDGRWQAVNRISEPLEEPRVPPATNTE
jgi:hypothetical protein